MGAGGSVSKGEDNGDKVVKKGIFGRSFHAPRLKRKGTEDNGMFGIALDFRGKKAQQSNESAPNGCVKCTCKVMLDCETVDKSADLYLTEYIEEEVKRVATWASQKPRCGLTHQGAKFIRVWFHAASAIEAPTSVRQIKPHFEDGEWVEPWHVSKWIKFEDPYTRVTSRFRIWRRAERTKLKPKPEIKQEDEDAENLMDQEEPDGDNFPQTESNEVAENP